jgi:hypothetical protein
MTTNLDVLFRYERQPSEAAMIALGKVHEVYGVRRIHVNEKEKTIRVEFDFTRLNRATIERLLQRAGIDIVEEISLIPPQPAPEVTTAAPALSK